MHTQVYYQGKSAHGRLSIIAIKVNIKNTAQQEKTHAKQRWVSLH